MKYTGKKFTLADIKAANEAAGHFFFSRDTMRAFGDTMRSFRVAHTMEMNQGFPREMIPAVYLIRVRPMRDNSGRNMGGLGERRHFDPDTGRISTVIREPEPTTGKPGQAEYPDHD